MTEALALVRAAAVGALLGGVFFGGLWQTVRRAVFSRYSGLWFAASMVLRTAVTLGGFYVFSRGRPASLAVSLLGFVAAQLITTRCARAARERPTRLASEATDAS
jgi:F1F0 ATPase subunit 2